MPRTLPWLSKPSDPTPSKRRNPASSSAAKKRRTISPVRVADDAQLVRPATPPHQNDELPSSPTMLAELEPLVAPEVQYMMEGYDADDGYMMVEDEFYSTARGFTKHLHQEEYIRRKKLAKSRMQEAKEDTIHGTDGITRQGNELKLKLKAGERAKSIKAGLRDAELEESPSESTFLSRLMRQDNTKVADLTGLLRTKVKTKAAAKLVPFDVRTNVKPASGVCVAAAGNVSRPTNSSMGLDQILEKHNGLNRPRKTVPMAEDTDDSDDLDASGPRVSAMSAPQRPPSRAVSGGKRTVASAMEQPLHVEDAFTQSTVARSSASDFLAKRRALLKQRQQ